MKKPIIVKVKDGLIEVFDIPHRINLEIHDYDIAGIDIDNYNTALDENNELYCLETFKGRKR